MSTTNLQPTHAVQSAPQDEQPACHTLTALTDRIISLTCAPALAELNTWLRSLEVNWSELEPLAGFKDANYSRHRIVRAAHAELLMICWQPGQRTPIHDHDGSYGTVRVLCGVMWETLFRMDGERGLAYQTVREWRAGQTTDGADVPDIHQIGNPDVSGQNLITLHLYAPPLTSLNIYRVGHRESEFSPAIEVA